MGMMSNVSRGYAFNEVTVGACTEGFEAEDWLHRIGGQTNHAQWLVGHVTAVRRFLLRAVGVELAIEPWEAHFDAGGGPGPGDDVAPAQLLEAFKDAGRRLEDALSSITEEKAGEKLAKPMPDGSDTIAGLVRFLYFHETYHVGQLGLLRRAVGKAGIA